MTTRAAPHLALVGPTASGKSDLALAAARALGDVEIVSVDSMQVYRGLDVGTAKPSAAERAAVPHHLVDVADPWEEWSAVRTQAGARAAVADIEARGRRALVVGGTGLYVRAVIDDLRFPGGDAALRAALEAWTAEPGGTAAAHAELARLDPAAAARIDPRNARRVVRGLEVIRVTGRRFSSFGPGIDAYAPPAFAIRLAGVWLPRAALSSRIERRFDVMRARGLVAEVERLAASPAGLSRTARQAISYKEVLAHLAGGPGAPSLDAALAAAARRTRSLARRQRMWFRRDPRITWFGTAANPCALLPALLAWWSRS